MADASDMTPMVPVGIAILTVSDSRDLKTDTSGTILQERIEAAGHKLIDRQIVRDDPGGIRAQVKAWIAHEGVNVVLTTGGTGLTGRDVTPETVAPLFDKTLDGFSVIFHQVSYQSVGLSTLQSRACAGLAGDTFIFCLPGSTGAVKDGWDKVIAAQLDSRNQPCNMVELFPRLQER